MNNLTKLILKKTLDGHIDIETSSEILQQLKTEQPNEIKDIAIIGVAIKLPKADNLEELWNNLLEERDCVGEFPASRYMDAKELMDTILPGENVEFSKGGYLENIDQFDHKFFNISYTEAKLMDPNQRLFLETAWEAIEDAGYSDKKITGSNTGVYLGYTNSMDSRYSQFIIGKDPAVTAASLPGNLSPIIASRISYVLGLKGPSILVDTACSSSLVALHLACRALQNKECDMAIAGGINLSLLPIWEKMIQLGIESSDAKVKTFDDSSDGVCWSEGVVSVLIKPLEQAISDKDNIYAVIKGSAINQDGNSVGITAPNGNAQEEVFTKAWEDAGIEADSISYIEAHGTGTKLGDPIEVEALTNSFRKYTNRKQFCSIGSIKSNIGHLNGASGMGGVIKAIVSFKNEKIPATINFSRPNRHIDFEQSPVYVNDTVREWKSEDTPRRCGISSFGFSGTNCHMVLEEPLLALSAKTNKTDGFQIFKLSAKTKEALFEIVRRYNIFLKQNPEADLKQVCYTANTGRGDYCCRLVILVKDKEELQKKLELIDFTELEGISDKSIFYGLHKIINEDKVQRGEYELTEYEKRKKTSLVDEIIRGIWKEDNTLNESMLEELSSLYTLGADIEWEELYQKRVERKISLPKYPFERTRCWLDIDSGKSMLANKQNTTERKIEEMHVLVNKGMVPSYDRDIYLTEISEKTHWFLSEHKIGDTYVAPGTTWVEALRFIGEKYYGKWKSQIEVLFIQPVTVKKDEQKDVQIVVEKQEGYYSFDIISRNSQKDADVGNWTVHAHGKLYKQDETRIAAPTVDIEQLKDKLNIKRNVNVEDYIGGPILFGPRWINLKYIYNRGNEYLGYISLNEEFIKDLDDYKIHPAMLDTAVNFANTSGFYLPMEYKSMQILNKMPSKFYSYIKKREGNENNLETQTFDILLIDEKGTVFAKIDDYTIKKVREGEFNADRTSKHYKYFMQEWIPYPTKSKKKPLKNGDIIVFNDEKGLGDELIQKFRELGKKVVIVERGTQFEKVEEDHFKVGYDESDYISLFQELMGYSIKYIFHMFTIQNEQEVNTFKTFEASQQVGVYSLFHLVRAMIWNKFKSEVNLFLLSEQVNKVTGNESRINYQYASLYGLGKVISTEYEFIKCRSIDIDNTTTTEQILSEIRDEGTFYQVAYRGAERYIEEMIETDIKNFEESDLKIREQGTYVITGGVGGIGLEVAKWLTSKAKVNLALINRSIFPARDKWQEILETGASKYHRAIEIIQAIESQGSRVECLSGNISDEEDTPMLLEDVRRRFGKINGVFHGAGVAGNGFIYNKTEGNLTEVLSPKIEGSWLLNEWTKQDEPDFFVMFSSINSLMGTPGQGDYTAANSFLDAFARATDKDGKRMMAINWPSWKETGMAVKFNVNDDKGIFKSISTKAALGALEEILDRKVSRVIVGELNSDCEIVDGSSQLSIKLEDKIQKELKKVFVKKVSAEEDGGVMLKGNSGAGYSETELQLADIWGKVLGASEIDIYDNFYSLGGDSILAVSLLKRLEKAYPGIFDITDIYTYSTIKKMSDYIKEQMNTDSVIRAAEIMDVREINQEDNGNLDSLLKKLESGELSVQEAEKLME